MEAKPEVSELCLVTWHLQCLSSFFTMYLDAKNTYHFHLQVVSSSNLTDIYVLTTTIWKYNIHNLKDNMDKDNVYKILQNGISAQLRRYHYSSCSTLIFSWYVLVIATTTETQLYKDMTSSKISSLHGNSKRDGLWICMADSFAVQ